MGIFRHLTNDGVNVPPFVRKEKAGLQSAADGVPQNDHALAEASLLDQLQIQPHAIREKPFSAADDHGADDHLELGNDKPNRGQFSTYLTSPLLTS